jgi:hypothetical protein
VIYDKTRLLSTIRLHNENYGQLTDYVYLHKFLTNTINYNNIKEYGNEI